MNSSLKKADILSWVLTVVVYAIVIVLHEMPQAESQPFFTDLQPAFHAVLNGSCFLLLIFSVLSVRKGNIGLHKRLNTLALVLSTVFLLSYVVYHYFAGDTIYGGDFKGLYYFVLISHIVLAGLSFPLILMTYMRGYLNEIESHRKWVKFAFPIWLYVTLTGVLVYLFLAPYY